MVNNVEKLDPRELQSLQLYLNEYRQQAEVFSQQLGILEEGRMETLGAIEALKGMEETGDSTVLLQLGGGASVRARVSNPEKVLVNIGAEVVVERSNQEAVEFLKDRITEMEASAKKVIETLDRVRTQMNEIGRRIEMGYQQAQMAQMGQMRPMGRMPAQEPEEE
ncbi:MAG TPA: prefoldin subunit alpha [Methanoregulaceae archaeon]|nr:prefoldin subunit alpha [Methanoregulaceae archaeon]